MLLRVDTSEVSVYIWSGLLMKCMHARLRSSKIKTDFPSLEDEIAQQRPDMIKVAAYTVSEKSINKGNNSL